MKSIISFVVIVVMMFIVISLLGVVGLIMKWYMLSSVVIVMSVR